MAFVVFGGAVVVAPAVVVADAAGETDDVVESFLRFFGGLSGTP